jgi:sulfite reductase (NADPH) hemoprotein beta-component
MTHRQPATFPRLGDVIGFCEPEDVAAVAEHSMCIQRDYGNRKDRAHARFKYTIEDRGVEWFRAELARRMGKPLAAPRGFSFDSSGDRYGWMQGEDGRWHYTLAIESGRVSDVPGRALMSGLRSIASSHTGLFALTTNQSITIAGIHERDRTGFVRLLRDYGIENDERASPTRQRALACVALPTCALAMAESERYLPHFMARLEGLLAEVGLERLPVSVRISGCPNGCSRPYLAEIALVGKAPGKYNLYIGGSPRGERLNALYRENVAEPEILAALRFALERYVAERSPDESFGDFAVRAELVRHIRHGREFQR